MRTIYDLDIALERDPQRVADTQALTLDASRPLIGLQGVYGLFGSTGWWENLKSEAMPLRIYEGTVVSLQFEGMHNEGRAFTLDLEDGSTFTYSLMANEKADLNLYEIGRYVRLTFFEELKKTGEVLEMLWKVEIGHT